MMFQMLEFLAWVAVGLISVVAVSLVAFFVSNVIREIRKNLK